VVVRFHWLVERTVPATAEPATPQTRFTLAPLSSEPFSAYAADGPDRRLTLPSVLRIVPTW
jgi:hypothetical protein